MNLDEFLDTLATPIVARPIQRMTKGELENNLDKAADILRGNANYLNAKLLFFAPKQVRYVLMHELSHTLERNHTSLFWAYLRQFEPISDFFSRIDVICMEADISVGTSGAGWKGGRLTMKTFLTHSMTTNRLTPGERPQSGSFALGNVVDEIARGCL